eukprot:653051-Rhodomonas_salina.1
MSCAAWPSRTSPRGGTCAGPNGTRRVLYHCIFVRRAVAGWLYGVRLKEAWDCTQGASGY